MNLTIQKNLTPINYSSRPAGGKVLYIVIHYFGGLGIAKNVAEYFASTYEETSVHYCLDEKPIVYQCVEDTDAAWHCGTTDGYKHPYCRNANSIGIEARPRKMREERAKWASDQDWYFDEQTLDNLVEFTRYLMDKYGIDVDHVLRHYDVTGKLCPRPFVGNDINDWYGSSGNAQWEMFKRRLVKPEPEKEEDMSGQEIFEKLRDYLAMLPTSKYAKEASEKAIRSGLFSDGDRDGLVDDPRGILTREQLAVVLDRAGLFDKNDDGR